MTLRRSRHIAVAVGALIALSTAAIPVAGQDLTPPPDDGSTSAIAACVEPDASAEPFGGGPLSMPEVFRIQLFDGVWQGIRDFYVDPEVNGLDWDAIGDEYGRLIVGTNDTDVVYELLAEMVEMLDDPYTNFFAPEELADAGSFDPTYGGIGALLDTSTAGQGTDGLRIIYVFEEGSALESGIRARDRIVAVDGESCARIADIRGPEGTDVTLTVISPGEEARDIVVPRRRISPLILPDAHRLENDPGIGYLRLNSLSGQETIDAAEQALTLWVRDEPIEGLILDVRATDQGAPGVILEILDSFVEGEVGAFHARLGDEAIDIEPDDLASDYASIPIVVLVDADSEAEAEQLAAILQDQDRALVIGSETAGETHGANNVDFPDGSLLQIVSFGFRLPDGEVLEGQGITPDITIDDDWLSFSEAEDPAIAAAVEALRSGLATTPADDVEPAADEDGPGAAGPSGSEPPVEPQASAEPSAAPAPTVTPIEG
jgi:carboxyl-terminal processing protease